ncbi:MAG: hypothetical protein ACLRZ2_04575 [Veillonella sp.]
MNGGRLIEILSTGNIWYGNFFTIGVYKLFTSPKYYFNRELSWLKFNQRVVLEAMDTSNPLMERLRFIAIASSNLDEFFMIRVAGLRHQAMNGIVKYDAAHMDAKAQLKAIDESVQRLVSLHIHIYIAF